jgi:hypothetical protein
MRTVMRLMRSVQEDVDDSGMLFVRCRRLSEIQKGSASAGVRVDRLLCLCCCRLWFAHRSNISWWDGYFQAHLVSLWLKKKVRMTCFDFLGL